MIRSLQQELQHSAAHILKYLSHEICDEADEAAAEAHSEGDVGNANDCVEAFLISLATEEAKT